MDFRLKEILDQLTAGIDIEPWRPLKKRPKTEAETVETTTVSKKQKTKIAMEQAPENKGVALFGHVQSRVDEATVPQSKGCDEQHLLERASSIRKRFEIKVAHPQHTPCPIISFQEIEEQTIELKGLNRYTTSKGYDRPTPIQMQAIPALLERRDVVGVAPTGSGKTLAFLLPLLACLRHNRTNNGIRALIVSPTCELSGQTYRTFLSLQQSLAGVYAPLSAFLLDKQSKHKLKNRKPAVLFATPLAIVKQIQKDIIDTCHIEFLILDEADRLFSTEKGTTDVGDMTQGRHYVAQLDVIVAACSHRDVIKAMFSATFPPHVSDLAHNVLIDPVGMTVGRKNGAVLSVEQHLLYTGSEQGKLLAIRQIFAKGFDPPVVMFVDTKQRVKELLVELRREGVNVAGMHSEMTGQMRNAILDRFRKGEIWVLIATDLVSRGIDFVGVSMVINYDFPKSTMDYIHRIGRTGRAGHTGTSYTFFTDGDRGYLRPIANTIKEAGGNVPHWMTTLKREDWKHKKSYGAIGQDKYLDE